MVKEFLNLEYHEEEEEGGEGATTLFCLFDFGFFGGRREERGLVTTKCLNIIL